VANDKRFIAKNGFASLGDSTVGSTVFTPQADLHILSSIADAAATTVKIGSEGSWGNNVPRLELAESSAGGTMHYGFSLTADGASTNNLLIRNHNNSTAGNVAISVDRVNGNVGINLASSASEALDVNGDVRVRGTGSTMAGTTVANASLLVGSSSVGIGIDDNEIIAAGGALYLGSLSGQPPAIFREGTTEYMRINNGGKVGIGTNNPNTRLSVEAFAATGGDNTRVFELRNQSATAYTADALTSYNAHTSYPIVNGATLTYHARGGQAGNIMTHAAGINSEPVVSDRIARLATQNTSTALYTRTYFAWDGAGTTAADSNVASAQLLETVAAAGQTGSRYGLYASGDVFYTGTLTLGQADTASAHINSYENMTFNIDTDNDDAGTRYFAWYTNGGAGSGTELIRLTENGNVGIGTDAPDTALHLFSSTGDTVLTIEADSDNDTEWDNPQIHFLTDGGLRTAAISGGNATNEGSPNNFNALNLQSQTIRFHTGSSQDFDLTSERMRIDDSGNVALVNGSPEFHFGTSSASHYNWRVAVQEAVDAGFEIASGTQVAGTGTGALNDTYTTRLTIKADTGNVGIGHTQPWSRLWVEKAGIDLETDWSFEDASSVAHLTLAGDNAHVRLHMGTLDVTPYAGYIQAGYDNSPDSGTGNSGNEPLLLNPLGSRVGINTTDPGSTTTLHVHGKGTQDVGVGRFTAEISSAAYGAGIDIVPIGATNHTSPFIRFYDTPTNGGYNSSTVDDTNWAIGADDTGVSSFKFVYGGANGSTKIQSIQGSGNAATPLTLTSDTNVGIGNTAPEGKLHVLGGTTRMEVQSVPNGVVSSNMSSLIEATEAQLQIMAVDTGSWASNIVLTNVPASGTNRHWTIHHAPATHPTNPNDLCFRYLETNTVGQIGGDGSGAVSETKMIITQDGNVGIGTNVPGHKLHVIGDEAVRLYSVTNGAGVHINFSDHQSGSYGQNGTLEYVHSDSQSFGSGNAFKFFGSETTMTLHVAGDIKATSDVTAYYSDPRLKDFHGTIPNALDKVNSLGGYYFTENARAKELGFTNDNMQVGVNAQEVEAVLPEVVTLAAIDDPEDYKTVKYDKMVPLLIEAIKELTEQNKEMKHRLDRLEKEL